MIIIESSRKYLTQLAKLVDEYRSFCNFESSPKETEEFLLGLMDRGDAVTFIAVDETTDTVMGFVNLYPCYSTLALQRLWILNDLGVAKEFRGQGISKALIEKALIFAKETGAIRVELKTERANSLARNLYKTIGFKVDNANIYYRVPI